MLDRVMEHDLSERMRWRTNLALNFSLFALHLLQLCVQHLILAGQDLQSLLQAASLLLCPTQLITVDLVLVTHKTSVRVYKAEKKLLVLLCTYALFTESRPKKRIATRRQQL